MTRARLTLTERKMAGKTPRGVCPVCKIGYRITREDTMYPHGARGNPCRGSYRTHIGIVEG